MILAPLWLPFGPSWRPLAIYPLGHLSASLGPKLERLSRGGNLGENSWSNSVPIFEKLFFYDVFLQDMSFSPSRFTLFFLDSICESLHYFDNHFIDSHMILPAFSLPFDQFWRPWAIYPLGHLSAPLGPKLEKWPRGDKLGENSWSSSVPIFDQFFVYDVFFCII